jgi:hypothetical protein
MGKENKMKRSVWLVPLALAACLSIACCSSTPARADHGDRRDRGDHNRQEQREVRERIFLDGDDIDGIRPEGQAEFRARGMRQELKVEAEEVDLPDGTILTVEINGMPIDMIELEEGEGELELNSEDGDLLPAVQEGDVLELVADDGSVVLCGTF